MDTRKQKQKFVESLLTLGSLLAVFLWTPLSDLRLALLKPYPFSGPRAEYQFSKSPENGSDTEPRSPAGVVRVGCK
jgi:hypothetical protein